MSSKSKLRKRREELGLRIIDVANLAGLSVTWVHLAEEGYKHISIRAKRALAKAVRATPEQLFGFGEFIDSVKTDTRSEAADGTEQARR